MTNTTSSTPTQPVEPSPNGESTLGPIVPPSKPLLSLDEFHQAMGGAIGRNTLYQLVRANRIRHVRLGRKILIPVKEVTDFPEREAQAN